MEEQEITVAYPVKHQLGKLVLCTTAGFLANKAVEIMYDRYVMNKLTKAAESQQ